MKIFVTGAAGFIGSRIAHALLARGDTVIGFDNFDPYYPRVHKDRHLRDLIPHKNFTFTEADLRNAPLLKDLFAQHQPHAVAHLAAMAAVRYSMEHPLIYGDINVTGTMNLLDAARQITHPGSPGPRCILASTGSVYGTSTPVPFLESTPADRPLAPYPASKRAMELMAHCYCHLWQLPTTILRFFNAYGPHGRPDMMPWQWTMDILAGKPLKLYNNGHIKRDWTYIDDIVTGFLAALDYTTAPNYEIINLGCSNPVENLEFVSILENLLHKRALIIDTPTPPSEPLITYADTTKAQRLLNYHPQVQVTEGLTRFVHWLHEEKLI